MTTVAAAASAVLALRSRLALASSCLKYSTRLIASFGADAFSWRLTSPGACWLVAVACTRALSSSPSGSRCGSGSGSGSCSATPSASLSGACTSLGRANASTRARMAAVRGSTSVQPGASWSVRSGGGVGLVNQPSRAPSMPISLSVSRSVSRSVCRSGSLSGSLCSRRKVGTGGLDRTFRKSLRSSSAAICNASRCCATCSPRAALISFSQGNEREREQCDAHTPRLPEPAPPHRVRQTHPRSSTACALHSPRNAARA